MRQKKAEVTRSEFSLNSSSGNLSGRMQSDVV